MFFAVYINYVNVDLRDAMVYFAKSNAQILNSALCDISSTKISAKIKRFMNI